MSWSLQKKKGHFLNHLFCSKEIFLTFVFYLKYIYSVLKSRLSVLNTLSEYTYLHISKTLYTPLVVFKIIESFQCILNMKHLIGSITFSVSAY